MKRVLRPFLRLQGKLMISYMLTSVFTFLIIELFAIGSILIQINVNVSQSVLSDAQKDARQASTYFVHEKPDSEAAESWLRLVVKDYQDQNSNQSSVFLLSIVTPENQTLATAGPESEGGRGTIQTKLSAQNRANLHKVLTDHQGKTSTVEDDRPGAIVAIAPIVDEKKQVRGALVLKSERPAIGVLGNVFFLLFLISGLFITILTTITGMVFGYLTARGLTRRLRGLSEVSNQWSNGNFSVQAHDTSVDEIGQMTRLFNEMAQQLQTLLQTRQQLATLEERNRLARDLHDSVKQQIFATSMQLRAAKMLLRRDINAADVRLAESEKMIQQVQRELTTLIHELRPTALEGRSFLLALREFSMQWAEQNSIVAMVHAEKVGKLLQALEEALFRVTQEALANVARHSKASQVHITISQMGQIVTLTIADNGQGFRREQPRAGVGLLSMRERMQAFGGDVQIKSTPGQGTQVIAQSPIIGIGGADVDSQQSSPPTQQHGR